MRWRVPARPFCGRAAPREGVSRRSEAEATDEAGEVRGAVRSGAGGTQRGSREDAVGDVSTAGSERSERLRSAASVRRPRDWGFGGVLRRSVINYL